MDVDITSMKIDLMNVKFEVCKCNQLGKGSKKKKKKIWNFPDLVGGWV